MLHIPNSSCFSVISRCSAYKPYIPRHHISLRQSLALLHIEQIFYLELLPRGGVDFTHTPPRQTMNFQEVFQRGPVRHHDRRDRERNPQILVLQVAA